MDVRGFYVLVGSNEYFIGIGGIGYVRVGIIFNVCGLGLLLFFEVGGLIWFV